MEQNEIQRVEGEIVAEGAELAPVKAEMEFRLINPTEGGFLQHIEWNRDELEAAVRAKVAEYDGIVYTDDTIQAAKADRAELNKLTKAIEERRKMVRKKVNEPYDAFEKELKDITSIIQKTVSIIDCRVKDYENRKKEEKKEAIRAIYDEVIGDLSQVLPFEKVFDSRYLNQTYKLAAAQAEVKAKVEKVRTDLETIDSLESKFKLNAKDVYIKTLDLSSAMAENRRLTDLEEKLEAEKRRKAREEAERKRLEEERRKAAEERARENAERKRLEEEERRKAAEEKARETEAQRMAQEAAGKAGAEVAAGTGAATENGFSDSKPADVAAGALNNRAEPAGSVPESAGNVPEPAGSVSESAGNVSGLAGSPQKTDKSIVAAPAGDAAVSDPFAPQEDTKQYKASFTVYGTRAQIMALKQYMVDNGMRFGKEEK